MMTATDNKFEHTFLSIVCLIKIIHLFYKNPMCYISRNIYIIETLVYVNIEGI